MRGAQGADQPGMHDDLADGYAAHALDGSNSGSPALAQVYALLCLAERVAELTQEIRRH